MRYTDLKIGTNQETELTAYVMDGSGKIIIVGRAGMETNEIHLSVSMAAALAGFLSGIVQGWGKS